MIRTPDRRLRVFVSSTLEELAEERRAVRRAVERLRLSPVMFELGARPHPPRDLYRAYLAQSDVFVGVYWQRYGWVAPGEEVSGLEDEYLLAAGLPRLLYLREPAPEREERLTTLLGRVRDADDASYRRFSTAEELEELVAEDLALMLSERFAAGPDDAARGDPRTAGPVVSLPSPLTRTIGREREVAAALDLLASGRRLVTVTGPGGVGKTRLALAVGQAVAGRRSDTEVRFVPLAPVTSPSLVMAAVAEQVGVRGSGEPDPLEALVGYFGSRPVLLLLDNLEQVVAVGPEISRLLERAPGLQVLATSRQALRVVGEHELPVAPLGVPEEGAEHDEIVRAPSVRLLVERAHERGIGLDLGGDRATAVASLTRRLAGLPLAIELAVPRLRLLGAEGLLRRLDSSLDLPSGGADLPARQRTLRDTLAWSHDLLDDDERTVFAQLGAFAGGATLEAVEAVCTLAGPAVESALAGLLDKSLLHLDDAATGGELRIQMLEPVRDFAVERLAVRDDAAAVHRRHLGYMVSLGRRAQPFLCGPHQREWAARFDAERANVRIAAATAFGESAHGSLLRLVWDTMVYYYVRDALDEPRRWLARLAHEMGRTQEPIDAALLGVGLLLVGEPPADQDAAVLLETATGVFDRAGLSLEAAVSRHNLGLLRLSRGEQASAFEVLAEASRRYAVLDHDWGVAHVEMTLGAAYASVGSHDDARGHLGRSLVSSRRIDNRHQVSVALQGLALVDALDGRLDAAALSLVEAAELVVADHSVTGATYCLEALAALVLEQGCPQDAVRLVGTARATRSRRGIPEWTAAGDVGERVLEAARVTVAARGSEAPVPPSADGVDVFALLTRRLAEACDELATHGSGRG